MVLPFSLNRPKGLRRKPKKKPKRKGRQRKPTTIPGLWFRHVEEAPQRLGLGLAWTGSGVWRVMCEGGERGCMVVSQLRCLACFLFGTRALDVSSFGSCVVFSSSGFLSV
jgi:hypothetical protein